MKVLQVHLSEEQHKRLRVMSAERCVAMSELVRWWIDGGIERGKVSEGGVVELVGKPVKTSPVANTESKNAKPFTFPKEGKDLKEGYGWCKGCGVNQVKLPAFLCKECGA